MKRIMSLLLVLCALMLCMGLETEAATTGICGENLTWSFEESTGTLTISGTKEMADFDMSNNAAPWYALRSQITMVIVESGVTGIGEDAFAYLHYLSEIVLPDTLSSIGDSAFYDCRRLKEISIPKNVISIGRGSFYGCDELTKISVDLDNRAYKSIDGILFDEDLNTLICYPAKKEGTNYVVPDSVAEIAASAFCGCTNLRVIDISDSVKTIGSNAFSYCSNLVEISISENVTSIGSGAFSGCICLKGIDVAEGNANYKSIDGVLFDKNCTNLMSYPSGKTENAYVIPYGVKSLAAWAFYDCINLTEIDIPDTVTNIGHGAFAKCSNIQNMTIPHSVVRIVDYGFSGCSGLSNITFTGAAPVFGEKVFSDVNATVFYPQNDETWDDGIRQNHGGTITWVPYSIEHVHKFGENNACTCGAYGGSCGEKMTWILDTEDVLTISGTGTMESYQGVQAPWYSNSSKIKRVVLEEGITTIGDWAFSSCSNLIEAVLPASLKEIGFGAFDCCEKLKSITIPEGVTAIGGQAFVDCNSLTEVEIPGSVVSIGKMAFSTLSIAKVTLHEGLVSIGEYAFASCPIAEIDLPSTLEGIGASAFSNCKNLTEIEISEGTVSIGKQAFWNCANLKSVSLPSSLNDLGYGAFGLCPQLTTISMNHGNAAYVVEDGVILTGDRSMIHTVIGGKKGSYSIPHTVSQIADYAFTECVNLTQITIPNSVETVGIWAFNGSSSLTEVTVPDSLEEIPYRMFACCDNLKKVTLPDTITSIASEAFAFSGKLEYVNIPDSVRELGSSAFRDCASLDGIRLPEGITTIKDWTFAGCASLKKIEIPASVTRMEVLSFLDCDQLSTVVFSGNAPWIASNVFWNTTASVYYPKNNSTWTTAKRKDYGGTLTWIAGSLCDAGHTEVVDAAVEAGCEDTGLTEGKHCSVCGKVLEAQVIVPATGHSFGKWVKTSKTEERRDCGNCDHYETREIVIVPLEAPVIEAGVVAATGKPRISWTAASGADFYRVYRADKKTGEYKYLKSTQSTGLTDTTAVVGKNYYYKVCSVKEEMGERSDWSNIVNRCCDLPAPEVILTVKTATGKPVVTWGAVNGAVKYRVYRSEKKDKGYSLLKTTSAASYTDTTAEVGVNYYYKVKAIHSNSSADSAYSEVVNRVCDLAKPEITITLKNGVPRITWKQVPDAAKCRIYRADSKSGTFELVKTAIVATGFTDTEVKSGNTYYYKVRAIHENASANSAYSSVKYITVK